MIVDGAERGPRSRIVGELDRRRVARPVGEHPGLEPGVRVAGVLDHGLEPGLGLVVGLVVERLAVAERQDLAHDGRRQRGIIGQAIDHDARGRPRAFLDRVDDRRRVPVALDPRAHGDVEVAPSQVLAADPIGIALDLIPIGRAPAALGATQREPGDQGLVIEVRVALEADRHQALLPRRAGRRRAATAPAGDHPREERGEDGSWAQGLRHRWPRSA